MSETFKPTPFGRYYLTDLLARGGMAELYRAKLFGASGFEKTIAVKKVLPQFSDDQNFLTMLSDEARLTVTLSHPNIVQLFDFGKIGNDYFIAMELVEGVDLKTLLTRMQERGQKIPVAIACYIMEEVCRGLQHAHTMKDGGGKPLEIVHRDISPQNILLSFNGEVKVTDFGIAKAASNLTHTQTGMIKGKVAYMSPEQGDGLTLDGRTDIFSAGLVLYEILTQKILFDGDSQFEILGKIKATHINMEMLPSTIPAELRAILAKALAHDVSNRYTSAADFQKALHQYLADRHAGTSAEAIAQFLREIFADKIEAREGQLEIPIDPKLKLELASQSGGIALPDISIDEGGATEVVDTVKVSTTGAILKSARRICWPLFGISFALFFFADFFKPALWLAPILMLLSGGTALTLYLSSIKRYLTVNPLSRVLHSKVGESFVFALISSIIWGIATVISVFTPPQGLLAANIAPVGTLQEQLFQMKSELTGLKSDLAKLEKTAAIVPNPRTPEEFYHNARQYQVQGKTDDAINAYAHFLKLKPSYVDVHQSYQALLRNSVGAEKTATIYEQMVKDLDNNPTVAAMAARLKPEEQRITALDELIQKFPASYYLMYERLKVYLDRGMGYLTTNEWIKSKQFYDTFIQHDSDAVLKAHILDSDFLQKAQQDLVLFDTMYAKFGSLRTKNPITINHEQYQDSISFTIFPQEADLRKILYAVDSTSKFEETGVDYNVLDVNTGKPAQRYQISLKVPSGKHTLYAKYIDNNGVESAIKEYPFEIFPFIVSFDPKAAIPGGRESTVDVTVEVLQGAAITSFEYSIDSNTVNQKISGTKATLKNLSKGTHMLSVRAHFANGTTSAIKKTPFYAP